MIEKKHSGDAGRRILRGGMRRQQKLVTLLAAAVLLHCCGTRYHSQAASSNVGPPPFPQDGVFSESYSVCPLSAFPDFGSSPGSVV